MANTRNTLADQLGSEVQFMGQNGVKQHLFSNGAGGLVTDVFDTLEEAVARFGKRIKVDAKVYAQSVNFRQGYAAQKYAPRPNADRVERIEYGFGYLKRLIENAQAAPKPKPVDMRLPHEVLQDQMKAEKAAVQSRIVAKEGGKPPYTHEQMMDAGKPARVPQTPNPAPPTFKAPPLLTPPEPKEEVAARLEASRAALLSPVIEEAADMDLDAPATKADMAASIGNIAKRRGRPPKSQ